MRKNKIDSIEQQLREVKATLAIEGLELTEEEEQLILSKVKGDVSRSEFLKLALQLVNKNG